MTINAKYIELIHREIDGLNSEKESAELKAFLDNNQQAQQLFHELRAVSEKLGEVNIVEPPEHLRTLIMNSIPKYKYAPAKKPGFGQKVAGIFVLKPRLQLALAFSGGLATGLLLFALFTANNSIPVSPDPAALYGTLALQNISNKLPIADQTEFNLEQIQGIAILKKSDNMMFLVMDIRPRTESEIQIDFNKEELSCIGFISNDDSAIALFNIDGRSVRFIPQNNCRIQLFFNKRTGADSALKMTIFESENIVFQHTFARATAGETEPR